MNHPRHVLMVSPAEYWAAHPSNGQLLNSFISFKKPSIFFKKLLFSLKKPAIFFNFQGKRDDFYGGAKQIPMSNENSLLLKEKIWCIPFPKI